MRHPGECNRYSQWGTLEGEFSGEQTQVHQPAQGGDAPPSPYPPMKVL